MHKSFNLFLPSVGNGSKRGDTELCLMWMRCEYFQNLTEEVCRWRLLLTEISASVFWLIQSWCPPGKTLLWRWADSTAQSPWDGFIPPYPLVTALVSAGISLGNCLALPESSGRMSVCTFYIKPQWCLGIRWNIWVLVPKAWESPSTEGKERGWWLMRGIYSLGRVQSCPDIHLEGVNFLVLVPLSLDLRENPDVPFSLVFVAVTWQDTNPTLLEWPLPLDRQLPAVPGFAEGCLTKISPFQCFSFLSSSHYNAALLLRVWGVSNCSHRRNPTVSWTSQPPWLIRHMEYKRLHCRALGWGIGNPATRAGMEITKQTALQCTV